MLYSVNLLDVNGNRRLSEDFESLGEAIGVYNDPWSYFNEDYHCDSTVAFEIEGQGTRKVRHNPDYISIADYFEDLEEAYRREEEIDEKLNEAIRTNNFGMSNTYED